jgi:ubiquinone/menaquinone biosynthesis C-methylase UbiE
METGTRERFLSPYHVASHVHVRPGDVVADFGAGSGAFLEPIAKKVSGDGKLICLDIDKLAVDRLGKKVKDAGLANVDVLWGDLETPQTVRVQDESLDIALLINTLFQCSEREMVVAQLYRTLRPGAVLYVVDWQDSFAGIGPATEHVVYKDAAIALFEAHLFILEREYPAGSFHYGLAFRRL